MTLPTDSTSCNACSSESTSTKHTCWRRDTDRESDEEPPPAKRQRTTDPQTNSNGGAHDGGQQFEIKMAAIIGLRGMQRGDDFELVTNVKDAGNFDDLVYTTNGRRYCLQLKHTTAPDTNKLEAKDLIKLLHKSFESYYSIQDKGKSEFIIYTNKRLGQTLLGHKSKKAGDDRVKEVFETSDEGEICIFTRDKSTKLDVYSRVENLLKKSKGFDKLSASEQKSKLEMLTEFLNKLIMVTGQKAECELDDVIVEEIRKQDAVKDVPEMHERELLYLKNPLESWWRNRNKKITPEILRNWLQEAKTTCCKSLVRSLFESCTKSLARTGIKFSDSEISRLQAELSNKPAVHLKSDALTLCSVLLLDCLDTSNCIFVTLESLQSNKNMLLYAWLGGNWEWLIVSCDSTVQQSDISDACLKISEISKRDPSNKRVIILTEQSVQQVGDFIPTEHKFKFEQLSKESQEMVLDKKIDFQGCEVTMRSVLQRHGNVEHVLGPALVTDLVREGTAVNIGRKLHVNTGYYAPRVLQREVWLHSTVLRNPNDVFAVSGATEEEVLKIVPSGKSVESVSIMEINMTDFTQDMSRRIFLIPDEYVENSFLAICEKIEGNPLHWVEFNNGDLLWKMSRGDTDSLLDYVDAEKTRADKRIIRECMKIGRREVNEESVWDLGERTVFVVAEPGMGKSSTTTQVARHTKERDPTSWVVRINWKDHTRKLQEIDAETFNLDTLVEFLCSAALLDTKYTDINRSLLKQALQSSGNVKVLMDGFDEISPTYADKAAVVLCTLLKTKVTRVWVTSRPVMKETLENKLSVIAYGIKSLSHKSQQEMLCKLWKCEGGGKEFKLLDFTDKLLWHLNQSVDDVNFTGCPLCLEMIGAFYEVDMETCLNSDVWFWPKINLVNLYERFVERKLHIYLTEKQKADISNSIFLDGHERLKQSYLEDFEKCALVDVLPPHMLQSFHNKNIEDEIQPFLDRVQAGEDKTVIVTNVVEGKPQFLHRTFAEYFAARWFSKNFQSSRSVLEHILFDIKYSFVRDMFDRMLAKDCPLHCAVLDGNLELVKALLETGYDVTAVDKGGRNIMHIIGTHPSLFLDIIYRASHYEVSLDTTDRVMQWTPLQYAIKSQNSCTAERLLERNVHRSGLDMMRWKASNPHYIGLIIIDAALRGNLLLLEFLYNIGVNIHQASSRRFPSPLHAAVESKQAVEVVRWLIQHGADCNTRDSDGQTPLKKALKGGCFDVARVLTKEGGASLDLHDKKDTCWTSATDSESVDDTNPAERKPKISPQSNKAGHAYDGGQQFEVKMAALIGLRGMQRGDDFKLATNVEDTGYFDDLVYTTNGRRYCLQLKHTANPGTNKLTQPELVSLLHRCFEGYKTMAHKDQSVFIIYTNKLLGPRLAKHNTAKADVDTIFKTSDEGKIFKFIPNKDKRSDIYTLLGKSLMESEQYSYLTDPQEEIKDFFNKLIIFTGQKDQWKLDHLIAEEIRNHDAIEVDPIEYKSILQLLKEPLETWWRSKKRENMTPDMLNDWLQRAKTQYYTPLVRGLFEICKRKIVRTGIKFSDSEILRFQAELSNKRAVHLRSDALPLCGTLLLDCLPQPKRIFVNFECLQTQTDKLLYAWLRGVWPWLIVSCDSTAEQSHVSHICKDICERMQSVTSKKCLIILTHCSVQEMQALTPIDHKFKFEQLSQRSQEMVLDKRIDFQGCEVTMRSVLQRHGNVEHSLGPELVTDLVTEGTPINIGGKLQANTDYYASRVLKRKIWVPLDILRKRGTYPDVFAVSGIEEDKLVALVPSDEEVGNFYFDEDSAIGNASHSSKFEKSRFIVLRGRNLKSFFLKRHENRCRETLHWLKYKHGKLLWKETRGDVENLIDCIDAEETGIDKRILTEFMKHRSCEVHEDSIWDLNERTVLMVAEPGMGKSSTTTQVARRTKERDPTSWVVRINWNDHTGKLQAIDAETFNLDTLVEFLCSAAFPESKYADFKRSLLKQALLSSGNVTVLMDGFDEISPTYADKAAVILSELLKTKVGRVWVTSRPVVRETLESKLGVTAFSLKKLSYDTQKQILIDLWLPKVNGQKDQALLVRFTNKAFQLVYELYQDKKFTGTPVYVKMIAFALELIVEENLKSGADYSFPKKMDLLHFYDILAERILHIKENEKKRVDATNASVQDESERMETCLENLKKCSLLAILPYQLNPLHDNKIEPRIQPYITRFQAGKDKVGIVMNVVDGKPQFVHRTLAEYFTARWFSENFESNRSVLEHILFDPSYRTMRNVFDRILARDCPLHCAVLDRDTQAVETLLQEGSDVNAQDKGGRTAIHLIAAEPHDSHICKEITDSLLRHGAWVDTKDNVLQWTPLQYARKTENSFVINRLLEICIDE